MDAFSPLMMYETLVPVRVSGLGMDCRKVVEFTPSKRSAFKFVTFVVLDTAKGAPAAVKEGASEKVLTPVKV